MQPQVAKVVFFYLLREQLDVEHVRCFGDVLRGAVLVEDVDAVVGGIVHVLFDAGDGDEPGGFGRRHVQRGGYLCRQFLLAFLGGGFGGNFHLEQTAVHHARAQCGEHLVGVSAPHLERGPDVVVVQADEVLQAGRVVVEARAVHVVVACADIPANTSDGGP